MKLWYNWSRRFKEGTFISRYKDLTGQKFGRLTVISYQGNDKHRNALWLCECECGNKIIKTARYLYHGKTISCGCWQKEIAQNMGKNNLKYPNAIPRLLSIWNGINYRCSNERCWDYKNYGERGIKVCDEWITSFSKFQEWALSNGYADDLTIERKDVNGDYCPENCEWIKNEEQTWNKRNTIKILFQGKQVKLKDVCDKYNIPYNRAAQRLRLGWDTEIALFAPCFYRGPKHGKLEKSEI